MTARATRGVTGLLVAAAVLSTATATLAAQAQDHGAHGTPAPVTHAGGANDHDPDEASAPLPAWIPPATDAARAAAFPDVHHAGHRERINMFVLADQVEWQQSSGRRDAVWDARGWIGRDVTRLWFRTDGDQGAGALHQARAQVFYGRAVHRWWDVLAGVRHDVRPGPAQTWAAFGVQGLAPYWFDVRATAYVGAGGRLQAEADVEYDLLLTNRLILQPRVEAVFSSADDVERRLSAGVSSTEAGVRVRYEVRREFAPYLGVSWQRTFGQPAAGAPVATASAGRLRAVAGVRAWF